MFTADECPHANAVQQRSPQPQKNHRKNAQRLNTNPTIFAHERHTATQRNPAPHACMHRHAHANLYRRSHHCNGDGRQLSPHAGDEVNSVAGDAVLSTSMSSAPRRSRWDSCVSLVHSAHSELTSYAVRPGSRYTDSCSSPSIHQPCSTPDAPPLLHS